MDFVLSFTVIVQDQYQCKTDAEKEGSCFCHIYERWQGQPIHGSSTMSTYKITKELKNCLDLIFNVIVCVPILARER